MKYTQGQSVQKIVEGGDSLWVYTDDTATVVVTPENVSANAVTTTVDRTDGVVKYGPYYKPTVVKVTATSLDADVRNYEFIANPTTEGEFGEVMAATGGMNANEVGDAIRNGRTPKSLAEMKTITGLSSGDTVYLSEGGRSGTFETLPAGDYSAEIAADQLEGVYVLLDDGQTLKRRLNGYVTPEMFGGVLDATTTDGTTGTDNTASFVELVNFANSGRIGIRAGSLRDSLAKGYLVGDIPELGSGVTISGDGDVSQLLISKQTLTNSFVRINGNQSGLKNIGVFCNDPTKKPYEITGASASSLGYQPILENVLIVGGLDGVSIEDGLEFRQQNVHVVNVAQDGFSISVPDALLINASTDNAGRFGFKINGDVVTTFHTHSIKSVSSGYRITFATASQMTGDQADTSGGHGFDINSNIGLRMSIPWSFKSGQDAGFSSPANYNLVNNTDVVLLAPFSNQDTSCDYAYFSSGNTNCLAIAPTDQGTKPSVFDDGFKVALAQGRLEKHNSLFLPQRKDNISIASAGTYDLTVDEPDEFSRAFNGFGYEGKIICRAATQNRILVGRFMMFTGANSGAVVSVPITWEYGVTSPDISSDITISLAHTLTGATLTIGNASAEAVAIGVAVTPFASAKTS